MRPTFPLPQLKDLTLVLTDQCNLGCAYCYVPKGRGQHMPRPLALDAVERFLAQAPRGRAVSISFFGGEPLLRLELMEAVMQTARELRPEGLSFTAPTNGTLLDAAALRTLRRHGLRLALSVDGLRPTAERPDAHGRGSRPLLEPALQALAGEDAPLLRMTVTPQNVAGLSEDIAALFARGFTRIMHLPALERPWGEGALARWAEEHRRLADWFHGRFAAHQPCPELSVLEGITARLCGGAPGLCGAGVTQAALAPDGKLYGCYRAVFDPAAERFTGEHAGAANTLLKDAQNPGFEVPDAAKV